MKNEELRKILENHKLWLVGDEDGERADLRWANLQGANLQEANLQMANLQEANLQWADLQWADLRDTDLRGAKLQEANLRGADLQGANLRGTNLQGVNLQWADLQGADPRGANLRGVNLDFSCWPLWCGSLDVKVDARIARQLAYHLCRLDCDDEEYLMVRDAIKGFANGFHRVEECGRIE